MALRQNPVVTGLKLLMPLSQRCWWLALLLWIIIVGPVQAAIELRVAIKKDVNSLKVGSSTKALVKDSSGRTLGEINELGSFDAKLASTGVRVGQWQARQLWIEPSGEGYVWIGDNWYRGRTRLLRQGNGIMAVNYVDLEQYLYSVVGAEAIATWPLEALKSQAVAARTYAIYKSTTSGNRFYDLDTTTKTQVYKGLSTEFLSTQEAVNATDGKVMTYNGKPILAAFHSSSGGHTENVEDVWNSTLPYLRGVLDYDQLAPVFQWTKTFSSSELTRKIGGIGTIREMTPERTTPLGRIVTMKVVGDRGSKRLSGSQLREILDLRSTLFSVSVNEGVFQINGRGFGHGLGLSQWGTNYLAEQGVSYQQILTHYYQNASLSDLEQSSYRASAN
jgi:stage II sporulation protein D